MQAAAIAVPDPLGGTNPRRDRAAAGAARRPGRGGVVPRAPGRDQGAALRRLRRRTAADADHRVAKYRLRADGAALVARATDLARPRRRVAARRRAVARGRGLSRSQSLFAEPRRRHDPANRSRRRSLVRLRARPLAARASGAGCAARATHHARAPGCRFRPTRGQFIGLLIRLPRRATGDRDRHLHRLQRADRGLALPEQGTCSPATSATEYTRVGRRSGRRPASSTKIELVLAPALQTLDVRLASRRGADYDFAFIDADKANYDAYYERCRN